MPLFGFGAYYDEPSGKCVRYKYATHPVDVAYAYVYMAFGKFKHFDILFEHFKEVFSLHKEHRSSSKFNNVSTNKMIVVVF